jgi:hypothetical protein
MALQAVIKRQIEKDGADYLLTSLYYNELILDGIKNLVIFY